jgi:hypothetical protein
MVLNTSFNRHGVPIVSTPRQAVQHLLEGNVDVLAIGDFVVRREQAQGRAEAISDESYLLLWEQLSFASELLRRGRLAGAKEVIRQSGLDINVGPRGFESGGALVWEPTHTDERLRDWWDGFWNRKLGVANDGVLRSR